MAMAGHGAKEEQQLVGRKGEEGMREWSVKEMSQGEWRWQAKLLYRGRMVAASILIG
jgi:hypothetical protein